MDSAAATTVREWALSVRTTGDDGTPGRMAPDELGEPVSPSSRLVEDFYIVVVIGAATPTNLPALRSGIEAQLARHPHFRSIQVKDKDGNLRWARTAVNVDSHLISPRLDPAAVSANPDKAVEDYVVSLSTLPMDRSPSRPLWEFHLLDFPTSEAASTAAIRVHHSLGDGMSLLTLLMSCTRSAADPARLPAMLPLPARAGAIYQRPRPSASVLAFAVWVWSFAVLAWHTVVDVVAFFATILFLKDPHTPFKRTVNDVLVGLTYAALSRYYFRTSGDTDIGKELRVRSILLVNLRPTTSLQAAAAILHRMISHTTISFSNMTGPVEQVEFCGHPVLFIAPSGYGPPEALTVNYQSYVNNIMVNLALDEGQFPDCHGLLDDFAESLGHIKDAALSLGKHHSKA